MQRVELEHGTQVWMDILIGTVRSDDCESSCFRGPCLVDMDNFRRLPSTRGSCHSDVECSRRISRAYLTAGVVAKVSWELYSFSDSFRDNRVVVTTTHDMHELSITWRVPGPRRPGIFCLRVNYCKTLKIPDLKTPNDFWRFLSGRFGPIFIWQPVQGPNMLNVIRTRPQA